METYQARVVQEKADLADKLMALTQFISSSPVFNGLDPAEKTRLRAQRDVMNEYHDILAERIEALK